MKVRELILLLEHMPDEADIHMDDTSIQNDDGYLDIAEIVEYEGELIIKPKY